MTKQGRLTPIRGALRESSSLVPSVKNGLTAMNRADRDCLDETVRGEFEDSLNVDDALRKGREQENRWDYLLGHGRSKEVIAVEPHAAKQDAVTTVIKKRNAARQQLREHLRETARVTKWLWVASGTVQFADTERARRRLDQNGIEFVGKRLMAKHLP